ncbi:CLUMA_CG005835, isoform A [Clunio marinus]|uniref:CLUMA_CG005835, isoform A n=1 Tax=Clunio marinus TaxID=568069 RepID=A0A1J1HXV5_9DIPT|nr:CLUMA_CG005835, isoform A [Clunio marinus]
MSAKAKMFYAKLKGDQMFKHSPQQQARNCQKECSFDMRNVELKPYVPHKLCKFVLKYYKQIRDIYK